MLQRVSKLKVLVQFVMVEADEGESGETEGGYAKEMSEDYQGRQAELVAQHIAKQDIVICAALFLVGQLRNSFLRKWLPAWPQAL